MKVFFKRSAGNGASEIVNPTNSDSDGLELAILHPKPGQPMDAVSPGRESLLVILGGRCSIAVKGMDAWDNLGGRSDVFDGVPTSVYVPSGLSHRISAAGPAEIAVWRAP